MEVLIGCCTRDNDPEAARRDWHEVEGRMEAGKDEEDSTGRLSKAATSEAHSAGDPSLQIDDVKVDSYGSRPGEASLDNMNSLRVRVSLGSWTSSSSVEDKVEVKSSASEVPLSASERVDHILNNSITWSLFVCILTIWALFADDLKVILLPKSVDNAWLIINIVILVVFLAEFTVCCIVSVGYNCSLAAMMDFLAAISLVPFEELLASVDGVGDSISVARVARAARAIRILRSIRAAAMALKSEARVRKVRRLMNKGPQQTSVLADTLLKSTNIKMLLGILSLLMVTTLLEYTERDRAGEAGLVILDRVYEQHYQFPRAALNAEEGWTNIWHDYRKTISGIRGDTLRELVLLHVWGTTYFSSSTEDLRKGDIEMYFAGNATWGSRSLAIVSTKSMNQTHAVNSMLMTIFSVFVIILWAWSFRRDHQKLVIEPVTRMVDTLQEMALDPRRAVEKAGTLDKSVGGQASEMEVIETCIGRFGGLLKVGFGEAGMGIIARNLGAESFDPVVPGRIVKAVFGFCDIRNFTDCCEVFKKDTMIFTNCVAHIVHGLVEKSGGCVNKNIGDAFLSVWKLKEIGKDEQFLSDNKSEAGSEAGTPSASLKRVNRSQSRFVHHLTGAENTCEETLRAFLKMNEQIKVSDAIQDFSNDPRLQAKLPGYTVRMGSGLHLGWAIEGAVGTSHKVDATYLSPHVNMSSRLEAATKQYGVNILMSNSLVDSFGMEMRSECRPIDKVTVKGSEEPLVLYIHMPSESPELDEEQRREFIRRWSKAFGLYQSGTDWEEAAAGMKECLKIFPRDQPAKVLLEFMRENGGNAPPDWPGYRALTSK